MMFYHCNCKLSLQQGKPLLLPVQIFLYFSSFMDFLGKPIWQPFIQQMVVSRYNKLGKNSKTLFSSLLLFSLSSHHKYQVLFCDATMTLSSRLNFKLQFQQQNYQPQYIRAIIDALWFSIRWFLLCYKLDQMCSWKQILATKWTLQYNWDILEAVTMEDQ